MVLPLEYNSYSISLLYSTVKIMFEIAWSEKSLGRVAPIAEGQIEARRQDMPTAIELERRA
jgi:hypothetical protein